MKYRILSTSTVYDLSEVLEIFRFKFLLIEHKIKTPDKLELLAIMLWTIYFFTCLENAIN